MVINVSKQYDFNPSLGSLTLNAFGRIGVRPAELEPTHMMQAEMSANFILAEFSNLQPNLWEVSQQNVPLLQGTASYTVPAETVMVLDLIISYGTPRTDRYINPISRTEYMSIPNKTQQAFPNSYWFDRLISPTITFWQVPDGNGPYTARYYSVRQTQDAVLAGGLTVEIPYRFLEAYTAGLAWKLSEIYNPSIEDKMFTRYQRAWNIAATDDTENVSLMIVPGVAGYFR